MFRSYSQQFSFILGHLTIQWQRLAKYYKVLLDITTHLSPHCLDCVYTTKELSVGVSDYSAPKANDSYSQACCGIDFYEFNSTSRMWL